MATNPAEGLSTSQPTDARIELIAQIRASASVTRAADKEENK